jgi:hypothetical protein
MKSTHFIKHLKIDLTEGSETSAKLNLTPGENPKENTQDSEHGETLESRKVELNIVDNYVLFIQGVSSLYLSRFLSFGLQSLCFSDSISQLRKSEEKLIACISFKYSVLASIPGTSTSEI